MQVNILSRKEISLLGNSETSIVLGMETSSPLTVDNFAFAAPALDMSSALQLQSTPNFNDDVDEDREISSSDSGHQQLSSLLQHQLLELYFCHVHPLCPAVDEFDFCHTFNSSSCDDGLPAGIAPVLFYAMMFTAFGHVDTTWLRQSPYQTLEDGQLSLVNQAQVLYERHPDGDHIILTQAALLLSYWSPYTREDRVNSFWIREAFRHANAARLWDPNCDSGALSSRRHLIWWCCLTRDRLTTCGLRRPRQLQEQSPPCQEVNVSDFGLEAMFPEFIDVQSKRRMINLFISFGKLTNIMHSVLLLWNSAAALCGSTGYHDLNSESGIFKDVQKIECQLDEWSKSYREELAKDIQITNLLSNRMTVHILNIVNDSLVVSLYSFLLRLPVANDASNGGLRLIALRKVNEASVRVSSHVHDLLGSVKVEDFPQWLMAWMILPLTLYTVKKRVCNMEAQQRGRFNTLSTLLRILDSRFSGVRYVRNMIGQVDTMVSERLWMKRAMSDTFSFLQYRWRKDSEDEELESEMLGCAICLVDLNLASKPCL